MDIDDDLLVDEDADLDPIARARAAAGALREERPSLATIADLLEALADSLEAERKRVVRLGFDLHDGALQDVALLGADMHVFREQLGTVDAHDNQRRIVGRVDDLIARLGVIDEQLRELATSAESSSLLARPLSTTLDETVASFDGPIEVTTTIDEGLDEAMLTDSQKIALLRVVRGALANAARHSGAKHVNVIVRQLADAVEAEICDDGNGFAVQATLRSAAAEGRLGLVGMRERARLLGGRLSVDSAPGGPTRVVLRLPRWRRD